jgi:hypothetical protein
LKTFCCLALTSFGSTRFRSRVFFTFWLPLYKYWTGVLSTTGINNSVLSFAMLPLIRKGSQGRLCKGRGRWQGRKFNHATCEAATGMGSMKLESETTKTQKEESILTIPCCYPVRPVIQRTVASEFLETWPRPFAQTIHGEGDVSDKLCTWIRAWHGSHEREVRFQALTAASTKVTVFWDIAPNSLVEVDRRFWVAYCLNQSPNDIGSTQLWNVGQLQRDYTALYPRRLSLHERQV